MSVTYYVALPFVRTEDGVAPGAAQEMPNERAAIRRAESMSRDSANAGALAFNGAGDAAGGAKRICQTCSISISAPVKSFGCKNSTGLPWAPVFGFPSPSTRAPLALS